MQFFPLFDKVCLFYLSENVLKELAFHNILCSIIKFCVPMLWYIQILLSHCLYLYVCDIIICNILYELNECPGTMKYSGIKIFLQKQ